jgi:hypothetical protein
MEVFTIVDNKMADGRSCEELATFMARNNTQAQIEGNTQVLILVKFLQNYNNKILFSSGLHLVM